MVTYRSKSTFIALENGEIFYGSSFGYQKNCVGELVFNTGMTGYQEILTDPSYAGQIVTMTYPAIGNYGINKDDFESRKAFLRGFIIGENNNPSNYLSEKSLSKYLVESKIPALSDIDTRALTLRIRKSGSLKACLVSDGKLSKEKAIAKAQNWKGLENQDYAQKVSCQNIALWEETQNNKEGHIVIYDFGVKYNIIRCLSQLNYKITLVPAKTDYQKVLTLQPDGILLSNGPADPIALDYAIANTQKLIKANIPIFGICLGHQILGLSLGCEVYKMAFGHHGVNHPVKNLINNKVEITSQNHNFVLKEKSINKNELIITHINLNDNTIAGIAHKKFPIFSVQYHPEAGPGPNDSFYLFEQFKTLIKNS